jgi:DNA-binding NarL/FixJ family response regulator
MPNVEVLIVDDHAFIHEILAAMVRKAVPGATVRAASTLGEAIAQARASSRLDLVLLDLRLPGCAGIEALARFRTALPKLRVAVVSAIEDAASVHAVFAAGAVGYIPKTTRPPVMVAAIRLIAEGGTYFPPHLMAMPPKEPRKVDLTERQGAVLRLLMKGLGNQQIAKKLEISENTVKQHTHAVYGALKVSSRTQAIVAAARLGIKPD